jgi:hypothetical protein
LKEVRKKRKRRKIKLKREKKIPEKHRWNKECGISGQKKK